MSVSILDMSLVEPHSFYQADMNEPFSQVAQATMEAKSLWSTRSSLDVDEEESYNGDDSEDDTDGSECSFDSRMQEAILVSERCQGMYV